MVQPLATEEEPHSPHLSLSPMFHSNFNADRIRDEDEYELLIVRGCTRFWLNELKRSRLPPGLVTLALDQPVN